MPRCDIDYSNTVIYKIVSNDLTITFTYVGHTTDFTKRKNKHKTDCNNSNSKSYNLKLYETIRESGGWDNWTMVLIENYKCNSGEEARKKERYWYEFYNADLNMRSPFISDEERVERNNKQKKKYYTENVDKINEKHNCECGGSYTTGRKLRHFETKKHRNFIETNGATF